MDMIMEKIYKVAIIGGGFSGLIAADKLSAKFHGDVIILEKNDRVGKKILATGNGRGNVTNEVLRAGNYHSVCGADVSFAISGHDGGDLRSYFRSKGVNTVVEDGRVYPSCFQASSVLDMLRLSVAHGGGAEKTCAKCEKIERRDGVFRIITDNGNYAAENVILACGGKAAKQYGTDGSAYSLAENFGHTVTALYPSLVQIKTNTEAIRGLKGLKQKVLASAYDKDIKLAETAGDILFTEYGVSGNAAFFLSSYVTDRPAAKLKIEFLPEVSEEALSAFLKEKAALGYIGADDALTGVINKQIGRAIIKN
ncbi:MAG: aminoacetone oxidase family FAD-binding enzyme, partial [Clostridia bacterium]|nr:aminoacetone oxidase family FAD-binding enzyme [Clostridia bacterium]